MCRRCCAYARDVALSWNSKLDGRTKSRARVLPHHRRRGLDETMWRVDIGGLVQIDDEPWMAARLYAPPPRRKESRGYAWRFWRFDWGAPASGEHRVAAVRRRRQHAAGAERPLPRQQENLLGEQRPDNPSSHHSLTARDCACPDSSSQERSGSRLNGTIAGEDCAVQNLPKGSVIPELLILLLKVHDRHRLPVAKRIGGSLTLRAKCGDGFRGACF